MRVINRLNLGKQRSLLAVLTIVGGLLMSQAFATGDDAGEGGLFNHELRRLHSSETVNLQTLAAGAPAVLVVNTASHCGFTGQFEGLEALHQDFAPRGLKVIGFSSDSFNQEADSEAAAADTCYVNFGVTFDMMATVPVRGASAHPLFAELARQSRAPRWNFNKYLINPAGEVVEVFGAMTKPSSAKMREAIEALL